MVCIQKAVSLEILLVWCPHGFARSFQPELGGVVRKGGGGVGAGSCVKEGGGGGWELW